MTLSDTAQPDEYRWHTGKVYPTEYPDTVEFIDTHKAFGRNKILRGLNMGIPEGMVSMILGPSGTGKSVCIKHMVGLLYPDEGDVLVHGESVPNMPDDELFEMRKKFGVLFQDGALFGSMNLFDNVAFPLRQHTEKGEDEIAEMSREHATGYEHDGPGVRCAIGTGHGGPTRQVSSTSQTARGADLLVQGTALPAAPEDITAEWLTHALGHDVAAAEFSEVAWGTATQDLNREPTRVQALSLNQHDSIRVRRSV